MSAPDDTPIPLDGPLEGEDYAAAKSALRGEIKKRVAAMSSEARAAASAVICDEIAKLPEYQKARRILFYHGLPDEVDLAALMDRAIGTGREVLLPVSDTERRELKVVSVEDPARDLRDGAYGILEPREGLPLGDPAALDLILVPGRAFDSAGGRLGRGKGYYDGFLSRLRPARADGPYKLGVGFACQLVESVPMQVRDVRMDAVATEKGVTGRAPPAAAEPGEGPA
jgi:5-formyltetrahydrofolate cyclo-ligase